MELPVSKPGLTSEPFRLHVKSHNLQQAVSPAETILFEPSPWMQRFQPPGFAARPVHAQFALSFPV